MTLVEVLRDEGRCQTLAEVPMEVWQEAKRLNYAEGLIYVISLYKLAARMRKVKDGVNQSAESKKIFLLFADATKELVCREDGKSKIVEALLLQNIASSCAVINGNDPRRQEHYRGSALIALYDVPEAEHDDDWKCVQMKVYVDYEESGATFSFDEARYKAALDFLAKHKSADVAGRREFLAHYLESKKRHEEALQILAPLSEDDHSAPDQLEQAKKLLAELSSPMSVK